MKKYDVWTNFVTGQHAEIYRSTSGIGSTPSINGRDTI